MSLAVPIIEPDREAMLLHLSTLFDGVFEGALDGLIELAWTDPGTKRLSHAAHFGTDQLEEIAERAAALNRTPNCNVYVGAALRGPSTARGRRSGDDDFQAAPFLWSDIDANTVSEAIGRCRARNLMPTMTIVTGRRPHTRAQLWWRFTESVTDPQILRALCADVAAALGGDTTVVNPSRVLRLGGSVAWPVKPGRVLERTEVHVPKDGRPAAYWLRQLSDGFGVFGTAARADEPATSDPQIPDDVPRTRSASDVDPQIRAEPPSGALSIGSLSSDAALKAVRSGAGWHETVIRLIAHWIARGWSDAEILATASALTGPGWTVDQTLRDLTPMIATARRKWNLPNPVHAIEDKPPLAPLAIEWEDGANAAMIPRRRWLVGSFAIRGQLTVLVAPPGAGKSTLGIALAVAAVTGRSDLIGETVHETVKAWIWNNEDDRNELRRRLAAVMQHWSILSEDLRGRLGLNSGSDRPLLVAKATKDGAVLRLPDIDAVAEIVKREGVGLLIVDPFVETHEVDENDNAQVKAVASLWREIARRCDCAVILVHHTGKPPAASPDAWTGSLAASRGASSLGGVARIMRTLFAMSEKDAERLGIEPERRHEFVRLDDAKANLSLASNVARWFQRISIAIANGDEVGVLAPIDMAAIAGTQDDVPDPTLDADVEAAIERNWSKGTPLSDRPEARERFAQAILARELKRPAEAIRDAIVRLQNAGVIRTETFCPRTKKKGLRVVPFDERTPSGDDR